MKSEKQKMLDGDLYRSSDAELKLDRTRARLLLKRLNESPADQEADRKLILKELLPHSGSNLVIEPPFQCDYGFNIETGADVFLNFNCVVLDVCKVRIGNRTMIGPAVQIYTATHPMDARERAEGVEFGKPVSIGDDVWIGGGAIICPGVTIGDRAVIGAGSVVTRDIPADVFAAGNPARVLKKLP